MVDLNGENGCLRELDRARIRDDFQDDLQDGSQGELLNGSQNGSPLQSIWDAPATFPIAAKGYIVLKGSTFKGDFQGKLSNGLSKSAGGVGLADASDAIVDSMTWGSVSASHPFTEGTKVATIPTNQSASRVPDGKDTNNNATDFVVGARTPGAANK
ncbi:MAG: hypothetical protein EOO74_02485 [Myxococcales bacterium]|nr:MAG: hypothetical protein EOO74_02485 [Myxococcales bacterium]